MKKGLQSLDYSFEADSLTHYGGLFLIQRFCNKLDLRRRLQRILRAAPAWTDFDPVDLVLMILFLLIAGVQRFNKSDKLQYDGFFLALLGLESLPDETSIRRFLKRLRKHDGEPPRSGTARAQGSTTSWIRPWRT